MSRLHYVLGLTVQAQRSIAGRVFRRYDRRDSPTKYQFFRLIPGIRPQKTLQYMNHHELQLVWRALAPFMDKLPGAWDIMLDNDDRRLPALRSTLDDMLAEEIARLRATGSQAHVVPLTEPVVPTKPMPRLSPPPTGPRSQRKRAAAAAAAATFAKATPSEASTDTDDAYTDDDARLDDCDSYDVPRRVTFQAPVPVKVPTSLGQYFSPPAPSTMPSAIPPMLAYPRPVVTSPASVLSGFDDEDLDGLDFDMDSPLPCPTYLMGAFCEAPPVPSLSAWSNPQGPHGWPPAPAAPVQPVNTLYVASPAVAPAGAWTPRPGVGGG